MFKYIINANWQDSGAKLQDLITPLATHDNFAILYHTNPDINTIYFATTDERIISELATAFELEEVATIDYKEDFDPGDFRGWEVRGNKSLLQSKEK